MNRKPKRCARCHKVIDLVTTDGINIFYGEIKLPLEPRRLDFPCPNCGADVKWKAQDKMEKAAQ